MKRALAQQLDPPDTSDFRDASDPITKVAEILSQPLPPSEPERTREITRRSEQVEKILSAAAVK